MKSIDRKIGLILLLVFSIFLITMGQLFFTFNLMKDDGVSINLAGSQRMRTMLLSDYSLMYINAIENDYDFDETKIIEVLKTENAKYNKIMKALIYGDSELGISANRNETIIDAINRLQSEIEPFTNAIDNVLQKNNIEENVIYINKNALSLKSDIDAIVAMYQSSYDNKIANLRFAMYLYLMIGLAILLAGVMIAKRTITKPIKDISEKLGRIAAGNGDLTQHIIVSNKDEIGELASNFNAFLKNIRSIVSGIDSTSKEVKSIISVTKEITNDVSETSNKLSVITSEIADGATSQAQDVSETARRINELGNDIQGISKLATDMHVFSTDIQKLNEDNIENIRNLSVQSAKNRGAANQINQSVDKLHASAQEIDTITDVITKIADQTNLLALNASIEAARAGEHGRGFAVVANEVRVLAEQSDASTSQITKLIKDIQSDISNTSQLMLEIMTITDEQTKAVETTTYGADKIQSVLMRIIEHIESVNESISVVDNNKNGVIGSVENISAVSQETAASTEEVAAFSDEFQQSVEEINEATSKLQNRADELASMVSLFKY